MKKKLEIGIFWTSNVTGTQSCFISLAVKLGLDIPLFDTEESATHYFQKLYASEQELIDNANKAIKASFKSNWLVTEPRLEKNNLPKKIYMRECWVIE